MQNIKFREVLSESWEKFNKQPGLCIGTFALYFAISLAAGLLETFIQKLIGFNPHIVSLLVGAFINFGTTLVFIDIVNDRPTSILRFFDAFNVYPKAFGQYLLNTICILLGCVLLIVPGIIFALGFSTGLYLVLEKKIGIIQSFKTSWAITKDYKWKLLGMFLLLILLNLAGAICLLIGLIVTVPLSAIVTIEVFRRLISNHEEKTGEKLCQI